MAVRYHELVSHYRHKLQVCLMYGELFLEAVSLLLLRVS